MAEFTIKIQDAAVVQELVDALCFFNNYVDQINNPAYDPEEFLEDGITPNPNYDPAPVIPNPETRGKFAKRMVGQTINRERLRYKRYQGKLALNDTIENDTAIIEML